MRIRIALALTVAEVDLARRAVTVARSLKDDATIGSTKSAGHPAAGAIGRRDS